MQKIVIILLVILAWFSLTAFAQIPVPTLVRIVRAEDARYFNSDLEEFLESDDPKVRARAALAAGRIGDEKAIPILASMLESDASADVRAMAAFALGETESLSAADAISKALHNDKTPDPVRARAVEAAGKIVGANAAKGKDANIDDLGEAILDVLEKEDARHAKQSREVVLAGLTAALRSHTARVTIPGLKKEEIEAIDTGKVVAPFLTNPDARVRADAANTISRARYKKANEVLRSMLVSEKDPVARSNFARALGAAVDTGAFDILLKAAIEDADSRVRVSAIRSLGALRDAKAVDKLIERGNKLTSNYTAGKTADSGGKNEALEIATVLGRLIPNTNNEKAIKYLHDLYQWGSYHDPETAIAWARVAPKSFLDVGGARVVLDKSATVYDWRYASSQAQALGDLAASEDKEIKAAARKQLDGVFEFTRTDGRMTYIAVPDQLQALAAFKPGDLNETLREYLKHDDVFIRATAAGIMADQPPAKENVEALKKAFDHAFLMDKEYDDAQLAILDALWKLDKKESVGILLIATNARDFLVRKKAIEYLQDKDLQKDFPGVPSSLGYLIGKGGDRPQPYSAAFGTKLGQVLNKPVDYTRAVSRKNGSVRAVVTTVKGAFTIELNPEDAPLTVDNFVKLARSGYFNGVFVHRVVPNFVMQDGDPRGDGNGGPGWSIRCEINMLPFDRGAVGMALSGKDTGGSQWFVTHAPQPHLDGGYTVFGHVNEKDMKVVDEIAREDKIVSIRIMEGKTPVKTGNRRSGNKKLI